jgi:hypothetical protein
MFRHTGKLLAALLATNSLWSANAAPAANAQVDLKSREGEQTNLPAVWPPPQEISALDCAVRLNRDVTIVTGDNTDSPTIDAVKAIVSGAGGTATVASESTGNGVQILIGTEKENGAAAAAAKALAGASADGLEPDGYVLASGKYNKQPTVVLNGVDARGTFYAAQTLRQLVDGGKAAPGVKVRDWPLMPIRGSIEGFYGVPWSHQARLDQYVFYGKHKMNTYIYTPKDDAFLRAKWRDLYDEEDLALLKELVDTANANHVDFTFALSPGLDICFSSEEDFKTTTARFDQVRDLGVHSFYIALDDISLKFQCDSDNEKWPSTGDQSRFAAAHAYYLNRLQEEYVVANGLNDLQTVPTQYAGSGTDSYKKEFGIKLDQKIRVQWTGEGVFSPNVTVESVKKADETYNTDNLYIWDNFPVNDNRPDRLFLNPLTGRDLELYKYLVGFTSNPMVQSYASMVALGNYGDYTWNGPKYDPEASFEAILRELAGSDDAVLDALTVFADINQNWPYREPDVHAPQLSKDVDAFWAARKASDKNGQKALRERLALIKTVPDALPKMPIEGFAPDVKPWSTLAMQWATACEHFIAMLDALDAGDKTTADSEYKSAQEWVAKTSAKTVSKIEDGKVVENGITPTTGDGVFDKFAEDATEVYKSQ